jgi:hypothetical protein
MTAGSPRLPALRVRLPCADERDFYARLADGIAERGLRIPTANLRPVGSRVRVVLEFRNAETVGGEAVVDAHVVGRDASTTMNVRFVRLDRPAPGGSPPATSAPAASASPAAVPDVAAAAGGASPDPSPETSFASLFDDEEDGPAAAPPPAAPPPSGQATDELELLLGDEPATGAEAPAPPALAAPPRAGAAVPARLLAVAGAGIALIAALGVLGYVIVRRSSPPPAPAAAAPPAEGALDAHIAAADRRMSDGRLTGPDGALDHLLAARALRPEDPRVARRLALLADTLETLGARALERADVAEAEVHLAAAWQAAPDRESIRAKLEALGKVPRKREGRSHRERGTGAADPNR